LHAIALPGHGAPIADTWGHNLEQIARAVAERGADVVIGYSHFFAGSFVKATNPAGVSGNADFYYSQWTWRF
jgi:hypothetical protein